MVDVFVGLGGNLGDKPQTLRAAVRTLAKDPGLRLKGMSALRPSAPVDGPPQPDYLNGVARFESIYSPRETLGRLQRVEHRFGRRRLTLNGPRTLDLDLLLYGNLTLNMPDLVLPHPRMEARQFVLEPLRDLVPSLQLVTGSLQGCLERLLTHG